MIKFKVKEVANVGSFSGNLSGQCWPFLMTKKIEEKNHTV
jgi:hypothetical protein